MSNTSLLQFKSEVPNRPDIITVFRGENIIGDLINNELIIDFTCPSLSLDELKQIVHYMEQFEPSFSLYDSNLEAEDYVDTFSEALEALGPDLRMNFFRNCFRRQIK